MLISKSKKKGYDMQIKPINHNYHFNLTKIKSFSFQKTNYTTPLHNDIFIHNNDVSNISFGKKDEKESGLKLNLSTEELEKRTSKDYFSRLQMLSPDSPEYKNLETGDKEALRHLVKAANYIENISLRQSNHMNIPFLNYLEEEISKGNEDAVKTKILFDAQKNVIADDYNSNSVILLKGAKDNDGKAFYPQDLTKKEFHKILKTMLKDGEDKEVERILNQRSIVKRDGNKLTSTDYTEEYREEFLKIADELEEAAKTSTNKDFNEFLLLQAAALRENDPMLDAYADKKWATLQDTPLEFTITRENYYDNFTASVYEDEELNKLLKERNITPYTKDSLGARVGVVNQEGTNNILGIKKYLPILAANMPYSDKYKQNISSNNDKEQTMVDVDIITLTGKEGAWDGGIVIAQNLPNNDKLSLNIGGGRRNVYHRQIRTNKSPEYEEKLKNKLNMVLNPELHKYYNDEADHWFTVGHENAHSLGPKDNNEALGINKNIIEENKADMASLAFLDILVNEGYYTEMQKKQILVTYVVNNFLKAKPTISQTHRVRSVMQNYYFIKEGAISVDKNGVININLDKMVPTAQKMLDEIIQVQLSKSSKCVDEYINKNFHWTQDMENVSQNLKKTNKILNGMLETPLADFLAN